MVTCALFVDYEAVLRSLRGRNFVPSHSQIAQLFRSTVAQYGELLYGRAYGPWDQYPEAMAVLDRLDIRPEYVESGRKDSVDLLISLGIQQYLRLPGPKAELFILVISGGESEHLIQLLYQEQKRVILWQVEGPDRLVCRAGDVVSLERGPTLPPYLAPALHGAEDSLGSEQLALSERLFQAMILRAESLMLARGWVQIPFLTLLYELAAAERFGHQGEHRRRLIIRGIEAGIFTPKRQLNPKRPGTETTFLMLCKEHRLVARTLRGVSRVVHQLQMLLASEPYPVRVTQEMLLQALYNDPLMPEDCCDEATGQAWLDLCLAEGLIRRAQPEGEQSADGSMATLRLQLEHPLVEQYLPGEDLTPLIQRLILKLAYYLDRTGHRWMSMGLLRKQLATQDQRAMERAIREAHDSGLLVTRPQPNQFGLRPTTGAYLQVDHPRVAATLALRDQILERLTERMAGTSPTAPPLLADWLEPLTQRSGLTAQEWTLLLRELHLLSPTETDWGTQAYQLNPIHPWLVRRANLVH